MLTTPLGRLFATRRVQKMTMIAEGAEAKRVEEAAEERKRKMEEKQRWEGEYSFHLPPNRLLGLSQSGRRADPSPLRPRSSQTRARSA